MTYCKYCKIKIRPVKDDFIGRQYHLKCSKIIQKDILTTASWFNQLCTKPLPNFTSQDANQYD